MALSRYQHAGAAPATSLASPIGSSDATFTVNSGTGYPDGSIGPFVICLDAGLASEEKVLCSARSGTLFTVAVSGRGYDTTSASAHTTTTNGVTHVCSAAEIDDASRHIYGNSGVLSDDHINYALLSGARAFTGAVVMNSTLAVTGTITGSSSVSGTSVVSSGAVSGTTITGTGEIQGTDFKATGLTGATAGGRFVGATTTGAPTSGTFSTGDYVIDQTGNVIVCTSGGTSGTWHSPAKGLIASGLGPSTQQDCGTIALFTLAANLINGRNYLLVASGTGTQVTATGTSAYMFVDDPSSYVATTRLFTAYGLVAAQLASGSYSFGFQASSTASETFTFHGVGTGSGAFRVAATTCQMAIYDMGF